MILINRWGLQEVVRSCEEAPKSGISALIKENLEKSFAPSIMWGYREDQTLDLWLPSLQKWEFLFIINHPVDGILLQQLEWTKTFPVVFTMQMTGNMNLFFCVNQRKCPPFPTQVTLVEKNTKLDWIPPSIAYLLMTQQHLKQRWQTFMWHFQIHDAKQMCRKKKNAEPGVTNEGLFPKTGKCLFRPLREARGELVENIIELQKAKPERTCGQRSVL